MRTNGCPLKGVGADRRHTSTVCNNPCEETYSQNPIEFDPRSIMFLELVTIRLPKVRGLVHEIFLVVAPILTRDGRLAPPPCVRKVLMAAFLLLVGRMRNDGVLCLFVIVAWMSVDAERHCKREYNEDSPFLDVVYIQPVDITS